MEPKGIKTIIKIIFFVIMAAFLIAALYFTHKEPFVEPNIDEDQTVKERIEQSTDWTDSDKEFIVFPVFQDGSKTDKRYALVYDKKASKNGIKRIAIVYYTVGNSKEDYENEIYLLSRPGVLLHYAKLKENDIFAFGPASIIKPDGDLADIYAAFSKSGWVTLNGVKTDTNDELLVYTSPHGKDVDIKGHRKAIKID